MTERIICALTFENSASPYRKMPHHCQEWMMSWKPCVGFSDFRAWTWPLAIGRCKLTAFSMQRRQFQWRVVPFSLTNGSASFTWLMNLALSGLTWTHCLVSLDDIIIWAPTFEDHIYHLWLVFDRIRAAVLKLKPTKCQFLRNEVTFLGHAVSPKRNKDRSGES